jgi:heat shock protein HslJ
VDHDLMSAVPMPRPVCRRRRRSTHRVALVALVIVATLGVGSCATPTDEDTRSATAGLPDTLQSLRAETWVLDGPGSEPPIAGDAVVTLTFGAHEVSGQGPCNRYHAPFSVDGDDGVDIGPVASTMIACDAEVSAAEHAYFGALERVDRANTVDPSRLELEGPGDLTLAFDEHDDAEG